MSFKAVDLQMAVHKTSDVGMVQHKLQQQPVQDQLALGAQAMKEADRKSRKPERLDQRPGGTIRDRHRGRGGTSKQGDNRQPTATEQGEPNKQQAGPPPSADPFKGRHIDLSL